MKFKTDTGMKKVLVGLAVAVIFMLAMASCSEHLCPAYSSQNTTEQPASNG